MRLLILTQKIDINDGVLGFFHRWVEKLAEQTESIIVICLQKGEYKLPPNVKILSLGKERGKSRFKYVLNFYRYIWQERKNYDSVFVHMNQEYVLLGAKFWKLWKKKILLWRNHKMGGFFARIAVFFSDIVFCTSQFAFVKKYKKTIVMPVGIDTEIFKSQDSRLKTKDSILCLGRISPVKKIEVLAEALKILKDKNINFKSKIMGDVPDKHRDYYERLKKQINIEPGVPNYKTPEIYNQYEIFVNLTPSGSLDKTIFEAMACGCITLLCNQSLAGQIDERLFFREGDARDLAEKIEKFLRLDDASKNNIIKSSRDFVIKNHSLDLLINKLLTYV